MIAAYAKRSSIRLIVLVLALSWLPWFVLSQLDVDDPASHPLYLIGGFGPLLAAVLCRWVDRRDPVEWHNPWLGRKSVSLLLGLPLLFGVVPIAIGGGVAPLIGGPPLDAAIGRSAIDGLGGVLPFVLITALAGPVTEEVAWHGYLWPRYRSFQGRVGASLVLGTLWGLWHLPLFSIDGTTQQAGGGVESLYFFFFMLSGVLQTYLFAYVYEATGFGVYAAVAMHFFINLTSYFFAFSWQARSVEMIVLAAFCVVSWFRLRAFDARIERSGSELIKRAAEQASP
ncbi:MAG TPA: type II CAAX endopeptidase family protein [Pseudomonadales bacterium]|nr:type II CAAX endopeptidase family protein [Pseudomonadales bacterium]